MVSPGRERNAPEAANEAHVMRSLRSLAFFSPAKAILVPGMYFFSLSE